MHDFQNKLFVVNIAFSIFNLACVLWYCLNRETKTDPANYPAKSNTIDDWTKIDGGYLDQKAVIDYFKYFVASDPKLHHEDIPVSKAKLNMGPSWYRAQVNSMTSPLQFLSKHYYIVHDKLSDSGVLLCSQYDKDFAMVMEYTKPSSPQDSSREAVLYRIVEMEIAALEAA